METPSPIVEVQLADAWPLSEWRELHTVVAVSGGADSMALLRAIWSLKKQSGGPGVVTAVHVNHQLRSEESDNDEKWLSEQCQQIGVRLVARRVEVEAKAAEDGDGLESAARELRYRVFTEIAHELGARYVATAHHRDDQVETILFRLLRGTGLRGLRGMSRTRPLSPSVTLVRPLLTCRREEILDYLESIGQPFREDASNEQNAFSRNRLRNMLLPQLREQFNQGVDQALLRLAVQAGEAYEVVEQQARELLDECRVEDSAESNCLLALKLTPLTKQPHAVVIETLRLAWREAGLPEQGMSDATWRVLAGLIRIHFAFPMGKKHTLPGNLLAECEKGMLRISKPH